ncbi:hypothetical protein HDIA_1039 [Hartmannibacter diazotrophicus]|uniref:SnoaL-like domain-containing protein n=1 Tax=Hartmannibacter diazotrophicus TaxID=1482074 RepID=A0A2C9D2U2_9HYPH|nr:nuclear transport factor 2 family protein [Hartmannibacter diazotrophicus]SON54580.1 hypothetical protein HDIA_1039 [Hartmannibacter diazotrophicus]
MTMTMPGPIAKYFAADRTGGEAFADCFAETAIVRDEGQVHEGRAAILRWKSGASAKYSYTSEPFAIEQDGEKTIVLSHLTGNFPGSPIDLRYAFTLEGDRIARLEIGS